MRAGRRFPELAARVLASAVCLALLAACASLPAPQSETDSILIIPVSVENETGMALKYDIRLGVETESGWLYYTVTERTRFVVIPHLVPGEHHINVQERYRGGSGRWLGLSSVDMTNAPGVLSVSDVFFSLHVGLTRGGFETRRASWPQVTPEMESDTLAAVSEWRNADRWM